MTPPDPRQLVVWAHDDKLRVRHDGDRWVLPPVLDLHGDPPDPAQLAAAAGVAAVVPAAPSLRTPQGTVLHPVRAVGGQQGGQVSTPNGMGWADLDTLTESPDVHTTLRQHLTAQTVAVPPERPDWYREGWYAEIETWIDSVLARSGDQRVGPSVPVKVWSLSAVLRTPVRSADGHTTDLWTKAACAWFAAEPAITAVLAKRWPDAVPDVVAVEPERSWLAMRPFVELDRGPHDTDAAVAAAVTLARMQVESIDLLDDLRAAGAPDRTLTPMLDGLRLVVHDSLELKLLDPAEREALRAAEPWLADQIEQLATCGLPVTVLHGDPHLGNVAWDGTHARIFDWSDGCVGHPLLDGVHLARSVGDEEASAAVRSAYAEVWRAAYPAVAWERAFGLAEVVERVFQATTYEQLARAQEPGTSSGLDGILSRILRRLIALNADR